MRLLGSLLLNEKPGVRVKTEFDRADIYKYGAVEFGFYSDPRFTLTPDLRLETVTDVS